MKQKNKAKYMKWLEERSKRGYSFVYAEGTLFGEKVDVLVTCKETNEGFKLEYSDPKSSLKFAPELVKQVRLNMFTKDKWLVNRFKQRTKDQKCNNCGRQYESILDDKGIALMMIEGSLNKHVCNDCGQKYIDLGAEDIEKKIKEHALVKESLLNNIRELGNYNENAYYATKLDDMEVKDLEKLYETKRAEKEESDRIRAIEVPEEDVGMESYLIEDYGVIEDPEWLKCVDQIKDYFSDDYGEYFECGQGYYEDKATVITKIGKKFFRVILHAEIEGSKQDRGDRLYWVESLEKVEYEEIDKPTPKEKVEYTFTLELTKEQKDKVDKYLKELGL